MGEEIQGAEEDTGWRKAIPEGRDRLQSRVLVGMVGSVLVAEAIVVLQPIYFRWGTEDSSELILLAKIVGISIGFALVVLALRATTMAGAIFGGMICLILLDGTSSRSHSIVQSGLAPLTLLFVLTFVSTRAGRRIKAKAGLAEKRGRSAAQVMANLSVAALSVSGVGSVLVLRGEVCCGGGYYRDWVYPAMMVMCLAALVEATSDTVSSEIGQAFGGQPVMLVGLRRVDVGTDGAVTLLGSGAGVVAGTLVAAVGVWALRLSVRDGAIALAAGVCGLFFDSLLGATLERRGWLGNDLVNFSSTVFAAGVALALRWWI